MKLHENLIIGAGPGGLAVAGRLRKLGRDFIMLERDQTVASMWHRHYDRLHLHTVKELSHLPHLPFPKDFPRYVPREKLIEYYESYASHFGITPIYDNAVRRIRHNGSHWIVNTEKEETYAASAVVVATGVNRIPITPTWPGMEKFEGEILHSREYRNPTPFLSQRVLVVGMGNTGAEIALDLTEHGIETYLSVRSEVNIVPRDILGRPIQLSARMLDKLPFGIGKWLGSMSTKLAIGDLTPYGLKPSPLHPVDQLKTYGKTPVIDLGTVAQIKKGNIKVVADLRSFAPDRVVTVDGKDLAIGVVILATGYKAGLSAILDNTDGLLNDQSLPKSWKGVGAHEGLYFVGFDNYKLGGILGTIYSDSEQIVRDIVKK